MKKVILVAAVGMLALASCKKDYTCECTTTDSSGFFDDVSTSVTINATKSDAETTCSGSEVTAGTLTTKCELK